MTKQERDALALAPSEVPIREITIKLFRDGRCMTSGPLQEKAVCEEMIHSAMLSVNQFHAESEAEEADKASRIVQPDRKIILTH